MGLRGRFLLPFLLLSLLGGGYLMYVWVPDYVDDEARFDHDRLLVQLELLHDVAIAHLRAGDDTHAEEHLQALLERYPAARSLVLEDPRSGLRIEKRRPGQPDAAGLVELVVPAHPAAGAARTTVRWDPEPGRLAVLQRLHRLQWAMAALAAAVLASGWLVLEFRVRRPVLRLARATACLTAGHADEPLPVAGNDEVGTLVRTFIRLRDGLDDRERELREARAGLEEQVAERTQALERANSALYHEVRERRAVEAELRRALAELRLQKSALDEHAIVAVADRRGRITYVNDRFCAISGYSREELLGQDHRIVGSGRHPQSFFREMWRTIGQGAAWHGEICNRSKSGALYWVATTIVPFLDEEGRPYQYISIRTDISQRKALEAEQEARARRLRDQQAALLDLLRCPALVEGDLDAAIRRISEVAARTLGCGRVGLWWLDEKRTALTAAAVYRLADDRYESGQVLEAASYPQYFRTLEMHRVIAAADAVNDPRTAEFAADYLAGQAVGATLDAPIYWEGNCVGVLCHENLGSVRAWQADEEQFAASLADMAALALHNARRRDAERALRLSEARFKAIAESLSDWIWELDAQGRYTWCSPGVERLLGYRPEELIGRDPLELMAPGEAERIRPLFGGALAAGVPLCDLEGWHLSRDGRRVYLLTNGIPLTDGDGHLLGYAGVDVDITARKETERALERARDTALQALRLKTEFLANVSHEVRTPLHGMLGLLGLLHDGQLGEREREYVAMCRRAGESLLALINNILDFSRLETRGLELEEVVFEPAEVICGVVELHSGNARARRLDLSVDVDPAASGPRRGDPMRLRQVLGNLLDNALKFTDEGGVRVRLEVAGDGALCFSVADTGGGIPAEHLARIFEPFVQGDGSSARVHEGSGLGLAICKQLVERMGGRIGVDSRPGHGSRFWFSLPLPPAAVAQRSAMLQ